MKNIWLREDHRFTRPDHRQFMIDPGYFLTQVLVTR